MSSMMHSGHMLAVTGACYNKCAEITACILFHVMTPICLASVQMQFDAQASQCRHCTSDKTRSSCYIQTTCMWRRPCVLRHTHEVASSAVHIPANVGGHFAPFINLRPRLKYNASYFIFGNISPLEADLDCLMILNNARVHVAMVELHAADWLVLSLKCKPGRETPSFTDVFILVSLPSLIFFFFLFCKLQSI